MLVEEEKLAASFARTACEVLIDQIGVDRAYREISELFALADEDLRQMYREIIEAMEAVRIGVASVK